MSNKNTFKYAIGIALALIAPSALAFSLFEPSSQDISRQYMGDIFNMPAVGVTGTQSPTWFVALFDKFNWLIFTAGIFLVSYVGILSTINTAQEGEVMGKKWSSVWIPLRSALGLIVLHPSSGTGYSLIQHTVMWVVMNGVGAADTLWNVVVDNIETGLGPKIYSGAPLLQSNAKTLAKSMINAAVCMEAVNAFSTNNSPLKITQTDAPDKSSDTQYTKITYFSIGDSSNSQYQNLCGQYQVTTTLTQKEIQSVTKAEITSISPSVIKNLTDTIHTARVQAVNNMFGEFLDLAKDIVKENIGPRDTSLPSLWVNGVSNGNGRLKIGGSGDPGGAVDQAENNYINTITPQSYANCQPLEDLEIPSCNTSSMNDVKDNAKRRGWLSASEYYRVLNKSQTIVIWPAAIAAIDISSPAESWHFGQNNPPNSQLQYYDFHDWNAVLQANPNDDVKNTINTSFAKNSNLLNYFGGLQSSATDGFDRFVNVMYLLNDGYTYSNKSQSKYKLAPVINDVDQSINDAFSPLHDLLENLRDNMADNLIQDNVDPLISVAQFGANLMENSETTFWLTLTAVLIVAGLSGVVVPLFIPLAGGSPVYQFSPMLQAIVPPITALIFSVAGALWAAGALLAVYVPLIPYIIYIMVAMGWFILVIEAIVSAPIFALALVLPAQDELGKITNGIQILGNIFLRPMFMVLGFLISILLIRVMITFIKITIFPLMDSMLGSNGIGSGGSFAPLAQLFIFEFLIISIISQGFQLIYILPDNVMRWIGGATESTGGRATEGLGTAKSGAEKGIGMGGSAMEGAGKTGSGLQEKGMDKMSGKIKGHNESEAAQAKQAEKAAAKAEKKEAKKAEKQKNNDADAT